MTYHIPSWMREITKESRTTGRRWIVLSIALGVLMLVAIVSVQAGPPGQPPVLDSQATLSGTDAPAPLGTSFTYQGKLAQSGTPVAGTCDFQFSLYDATTTGTQIGTTQSLGGVGVEDGVFTVQLDFGGGAFQGNGRWLQIAVRCPAGTGSYTTLAPRQALTPAPYALALPGLWTQQDTTSPNLIGGYSGNSVAPGVYGATISGGGQNGTINMVTADFGTIGGGAHNTASHWCATIGGGYGNTASGRGAFVGGGGFDGDLMLGNEASGNASTVSGGLGNTASGIHSTIGGGAHNTAGNWMSTVGGGGAISVTGQAATVAGGSLITATGDYAAVGGGQYHTASGYASVIGGGGSNTASHWYTAIGGGSGNAASGWAATVGGGGSNTASNWYATVVGGIANEASGVGAFVGGGGYDSFTTDGNEASGNTSTVVGGLGNTASGDRSAVGGGAYNTADGVYAAVSGGYGNSASGDGSIVGGGWDNAVAGFYATVGGGSNNTASNWHATIGGGKHINVTGQVATVAGGSHITVTGDYVAVGGGCNNIVDAPYGTIAGGGYADSAWGNRVTDEGGTISGGGNNQAGNGTGPTTDAYYATVGGGWDNIASKKYATVPGGEGNTAAGDHSLAAGRRAQANNQGCFVWGDSTNADVSCNDDDRWIARASGGVYFYSSSDLGHGVYLAEGADSWSPIWTSDRDQKVSFVPVDGGDIAARLAEVPITTWSYAAGDPTVRHIGPVSQDFYAAFGLGEDDGHISAVDANGVALAAIQGLYQMVQEKENQIAAQQAQIDALRQQNEDLAVRMTALEQVTGSGQTSGFSINWSLLGVLLLVGVMLAQRQRMGGRR